MDKSDKLNEKFDELENLIKSANQTTYSEHWKAVSEYVHRAAYIVWNFDKPLEQLELELDKSYKASREFEGILKMVLSQVSAENAESD